MIEAFLYGGEPFRHTGEHASAQPIDGQVAKEALDHVQSRRRGQREVHVKTRTLAQPRPHDRVLEPSPFFASLLFSLLYRYEVPSVFRLPKGVFHAASVP